MTTSHENPCYCVYGFFTQRGEPLYVGATVDFTRRKAAHRQKSWWQNVDQRRTVIVSVSSATEAALMEARTIDALHPRHNRIRPSRGGYYRGRWTEPRNVRAQTYRELAARTRYAIAHQRVRDTSPSGAGSSYNETAFRLAIIEARKLRIIFRAIAEDADLPVKRITEIAAEAGISRGRVTQIETDSR